MGNENINIGWNFENTYISLPDIMYEKVTPQSVKNPSMLILNDDLSNELGLDFSSLSESSLSDLCSGNTLPEGAVHLASNKINKIQSVNFKLGNSDVWGLQYHPEITYHKMITLINFRKDRLINDRKCFKDEKEIQNHINFIEKEIKISKKDSRMLELKNWLEYLKVA